MKRFALVVTGLIVAIVVGFSLVFTGIVFTSKWPLRLDGLLPVSAGSQTWKETRVAIFPNVVWTRPHRDRPLVALPPAPTMRLQGHCTSARGGCLVCTDENGRLRVLLCPSPVKPEAFENLVRIGEGRPREEKGP